LKNKFILFNPRSANSKYRVPNSILQVGASIHGKDEYVPVNSSAKVMKQIEADIQFIKEIKNINPHTEIIIYIYSPVPTEGSELFKRITEAGFSFPKRLEDWLSPDWLHFDLLKIL
jgi:hypothetical protein